MSTVVMTMKQIVSNIKNQASGGKFIIPEAIADIGRVYIYFSGDEFDEVLNVDLYQMV